MATRGQRIDWEDLAHEHGFPDDKAMLEKWYEAEEMSQEEIALKLDMCNKTVSERMRFYGMTVRRTGGKAGVPQGR